MDFEDAIKKIKFLSKVQDYLIIKTLGNISEFKISVVDNKIKVINSGDSFIFVDKIFWDKVVYRMSLLEEDKKDRGTYYTITHWSYPDNPNNLFSPTIPAIIRKLEGKEKIVSVPKNFKKIIQKYVIGIFIIIFLYVLYSIFSYVLSERQKPLINKTDVNLVNSINSNLVGVNKNKTSNKIIQNTTIIGTYNGVQPRYNVKDKYGDDLLINGQKLSVPSSEYKYLFQEKNIVSLKLTALEENGKSYYYEGNYSVISEDKKTIVLKCRMYLEETNANPTHIITIDKTNKTATEKGDDASNVELKFLE